MAKKAKRAFQMMLSWLGARATDEGRIALTADEGRRLLSSERGRQLAFEAYHRLDFTALEEEPEETGDIDPTDLPALEEEPEETGGLVAPCWRVGLNRKVPLPYFFLCHPHSLVYVDK